MNEDQTQGGDRRSVVIIALGVAVVVLIGIIVGFAVSGGFDDDPPVAASSTTTTTVTLPPASTAPTTTLPSDEPTTTIVAPLTPLPTQPPDTSVDGQATFTATEDTYIDSTEATANHGLELGLAVENDAPELKLSLVRFDINAIPDGEEVVSATLELYVVAGAGEVVSVHQVDGEWTEIETTAANAPQVGDTIISIGEGYDELAVVQVDVTAAVAGNAVLDFYLVTESPRTTEFGSRESLIPPRVTVVWEG